MAASRKCSAGLFHIRILDEELTRRARTNSRYSLRAFAAQLELHPSALSRILAGKQRLSKTAAMKVAEKMAMEKEMGRLFLQSVVEEHRKNEAERLGEAVEAPALRPCPVLIDEELFSKISNIKSLAILELVFTKDFSSQPEWIAERLGISPEEAAQTVADLLAAGMLEEREGNLVNKRCYTSAIDSEKTSAARKSLQKEVLALAASSVEQIPFEKRGHFSMTLTADPAKMAEANRMTVEFMESLSDFLGSGDRTEVYELSVQLFPLTK